MVIPTCTFSCVWSQIVNQKNNNNNNNNRQQQQH